MKNYQTIAIIDIAMNAGICFSGMTISHSTLDPCFREDDKEKVFHAFVLA